MPTVLTIVRYAPMEAVVTVLAEVVTMKLSIRLGLTTISEKYLASSGLLLLNPGIDNYKPETFRSCARHE